MKRKFSLGLMVGFFALILPLCVKADEFSIDVSCEHIGRGDCSESNNIYEIGTGETARFTFTINDTSVQSFSGAVTLSDKLTGLSNFNPNTLYWADMSQIGGNNGYENGHIGLMKKASGATGEAKFSFDVTAGDTTGEANVTISSISILNSQSQSVSMSDIALNLNIVQSTENNQNNNNDNTNTGTDTNTDTNTSDNTDTNNDKNTDTKKEEPVSPDTGVSISLLGIGALVLGGISYIVLKNKNYFNRI